MATPNNSQGMPLGSSGVPLAVAQQLQYMGRTHPGQYQDMWKTFFEVNPTLRAHATSPEVQQRFQLWVADYFSKQHVPLPMPLSGGPTASGGAASGGSVGAAAAGRMARQASGPVSADALLSATAASTTALAARAAIAREASLKKLQTTLSFLSRPTNPDEKTFLPKKRLATLFQKACGGGGKLAPEAEAGVRALAEDFSKGALAFAVAMARRRRSASLDPADVALYVKRTYDVDIPGFGRAEVAPYRRLGGSEVHKARLAAVRRANVAMTRQVGAAGGKAGGAAAAPAAKGKKGGAKATAATRKAAARAAAVAEDDDDMEHEDALEEELGGGAAEEEDMPDF